MHTEVYTDGVEEVTVSGSIVRVDLVSLSPTERGADNKPKKVFRQRLIFSAEAFANSVEVMKTALAGLVDAGVVKRNPPRSGSDPLQQNPSDPAPTASSSPTTSLRSPNVSANFR